MTPVPGRCVYPELGGEWGWGVKEGRETAFTAPPVSAHPTALRRGQLEEDEEQKDEEMQEEEEEGLSSTRSRSLAESGKLPPEASLFEPQLPPSPYHQRPTDRRKIPPLQRDFPGKDDHRLLHRGFTSARKGTHNFSSHPLKQGPKNPPDPPVLFQDPHPPSVKLHNSLNWSSDNTSDGETLCLALSLISDMYLLLMLKYHSYLHPTHIHMLGE